MKCKCPNCHAAGSLEMFISHNEASQAFLAVLNLTGELAKPLVRYLGLFRSENRDLSFERTTKLINEIAPDIVSGKISRNRQTYPAPKRAWIWAINVMLERREQGLLQLPLKSHGYLYEVISSYKVDEQQQRYFSQTNENKRSYLVTEPSRLERDIAQRQEQHYQSRLKEHEEQKSQPINPSIKELFRFINKMRQPDNDDSESRTLKGISIEQLPVYLMGKRNKGETLEDCFQRLKKLERESEENESKEN